jgi:hypothetical protein
MTKPARIKIGRDDAKDLIRDELLGYACQGHEKCVFGKNFILIPVADVHKLAKRIARRAVIGH